MTLVKRILLALAILVALLVVVALFLPSKYYVERSVAISAPVELIFPYVANVEKQQLWSPWKASDPTRQVTYGPIKEGNGATYSWTSQKSGDGAMVLDSMRPAEAIYASLDFGKRGKSKANYFFASEGNSVKVTEAFSGDAGYNLVGRYFNLAMDKMIGGYFEKGLASLKTLAEADAKLAAAQAAAAADSVSKVVSDSTETEAKPIE